MDGRALIRKNKMAAAHIEGSLNVVTGKTTCILFVYVTINKNPTFTNT
jgi:hypothetical protein